MTNTRDTRMVMIVDSEPAQQRFLSALASRGGWRSVIAPDTDTALAKLGTQEGMALGAVLVDQGAPGMDIAEFVAELRRWRPALPLVVITMRNGVEVAVGAMRAGASDFVQKPIAPDRLLEALDRVVSTGGPQGELRPLTEKLRAPLAFEEIIGRSEEHTSELQSLMRISYAVFCLKKKKPTNQQHYSNSTRQTPQLTEQRHRTQHD